jgi:hypothetical protein
MFWHMVGDGWENLFHKAGTFLLSEFTWVEFQVKIMWRNFRTSPTDTSSFHFNSNFSFIFRALRDKISRHSFCFRERKWCRRKLLEWMNTTFAKFIVESSQLFDAKQTCFHKAPSTIYFNFIKIIFFSCEISSPWKREKKMHRGHHSVEIALNNHEIVGHKTNPNHYVNE